MPLLRKSTRMPASHSHQNFRATLDAAANLANFLNNLTSLIRIRRRLILMPMSNPSRRLETATKQSLDAKRRIMAAEQSVARTLLEMVRDDRGGRPAEQRPCKNVTPKKS